MEQTLNRRLLIPETLLIQLPEAVKIELLESTVSKQDLFLKLYGDKSKSLFLTYLFMVPVVLSFHYGALNLWTRQMLFWATGGGFLVWWLVDVVRLPSLIKEYNYTLACQIWEEVSSIGEGPAEGLF